MSIAPITLEELLPNGLQGLQAFTSARLLLATLHAHRAHPNRQFHYDELALWLLTSFFNPTLDSLRALQAASTFEGVQQRTGLAQFSLGAFSEAARVFDPELLHHIFRDLAAQTQLPAQPSPASLPPQVRVLLSDGSVWKALPRMAHTFYAGPLTRCRKGEFKGHFLFDVLRGLPEELTVTKGSTDERHVLPQQLTAGMLYVIDRGYLSLLLLNHILAAKASFLVRAKENGAFTTLEAFALTAPASAAGVVSDERVRWQGLSLRRVVVQRRIPPPTNLHPRCKNGKHRAAPLAGGEQVWMLLTDRFDLSAEDIALLYAWRWQIELFFRWLKCVLHCRHFFSESENGFAIQLYVALIATLLVAQVAGCKPNKRLLEALRLYLGNWATERDVLKVLQRCQSAKPA